MQRAGWQQNEHAVVRRHCAAVAPSLGETNQDQVLTPACACVRSTQLRSGSCVMSSPNAPAKAPPRKATGS
jgi:hypothetical protein